MTEKKRYLLNRDDDGHWYLLAEEDAEAFSAYVYEEGPEPASMQRLAGHPNNVTFEAPQEFGKAMTE
jgi:hypothetical protein